MNGRAGLLVCGGRGCEVMARGAMPSCFMRHASCAIATSLLSKMLNLLDRSSSSALQDDVGGLALGCIERVHPLGE